MDTKKFKFELMNTYGVPEPRPANRGYPHYTLNVKPLKSLLKKQFQFEFDIVKDELFEEIDPLQKVMDKGIDKTPQHIEYELKSKYTMAMKQLQKYQYAEIMKIEQLRKEIKLARKEVEHLITEREEPVVK
jgi:hypothetical protein